MSGLSARRLRYTILDRTGNAAGSYTTPTYRSESIQGIAASIRSENPGLSYYDALAVQVNKRFSQDFKHPMSYTWSHGDRLQSGYR